MPDEKYPYNNFVGHLLDPRGAVLKRLEGEKGCRIMISGKGGIGKDKEEKSEKIGLRERLYRAVGRHHRGR